MSLISDLNLIELPPINDIYLQHVDVKHCQGCQERELEIKGWKKDVPHFKKKYEFDDIHHRNDIIKIEVKRHIYKLKHKAGLVVWHKPNHSSCYNYLIETIECIFERTSFQVDNDPSSTLFHHVCAGHEYFLGKYSTHIKALSKANKEAEKLKKDLNIKTESITYKIINKHSDKKIKKKYFSSLDLINNYAVFILYNHHDNSSKCSTHPDFVVTRFIRLDPERGPVYY